MKESTSINPAATSLDRLMDLATQTWGIKRSVTELSRRLDESTQTLHHWSGERGVSRRGAEMCQRKFGWSSTWILEGEGPRYVTHHNGDGAAANDGERRVERRKITVLGSIGLTDGHLVIDTFPTEGVPNVGATIGGDDAAGAGFVLDTDALLPRYRRDQVLVVGDAGNATGGDDVLVQCLAGDIRVCQYLYRVGETFTMATLSEGNQFTLRAKDIETMQPIVGTTRSIPDLIQGRTKTGT